MLILAMGSNFHTFYPRQPQQGLILHTPNARQYEILSKESVFLQFCDEIQSSMHQILTQMYSSVSRGTSNMESPTGFSNTPPHSRSRIPFKPCFPTFYNRISFSCCLPIFSLIDKRVTKNFSEQRRFRRI